MAIAAEPALTALVPASVYLALAEPHFIEVHADCDVEIVFLYERVGIGRTVFELEAEVHYCAETGHWEAETCCHSEFAQAVGIAVLAEDFEVVAGVISSQAVAHALEVAAALVGLEFQAEGIFAAVGEAEGGGSVFVAAVSGFAPGLICVVEFSGKTAGECTIFLRPISRAVNSCRAANDGP